MALLKQPKIRQFFCTSHTITHSHVVVLNSYFCKQNQKRACVAKIDYTDFLKKYIFKSFLLAYRVH